MVSRLSFVVSLFVHGAALGTACAFSTGGAAPARVLRIEMQASVDAVAMPEPVPPPVEVVPVERVEEQRLVDQLVEPLAPEPAIEAEAFDIPVAAQSQPPKATEPTLALLAAVRPRPVAEPVEPLPVQPAPAALVLEAIPGENQPPEYPMLARRRGWQGVVAIFVHVDSNGQVSLAAVARSSGHDVLDQAALQAVRGWRFRGGSGETTVEVEFRLRD